MPMSPRLLRPRSSGPGAIVAADADARTYLAAVHVADGQPLEVGVQQAIDAFVVGCKADGIWSAIKASCIMMGARTLSGALTPLVGAAPTNANFVSGDYARKTGLLGNGSTKRLNTNRNNNADPQNSFHMSCYVTVPATGTDRVIIGYGFNLTGSSEIVPIATNLMPCRNRTANASAPGPSISGFTNGIMATNRSASSSFVMRARGTQTTGTATSELPASGDITLFCRNSSNSFSVFSGDRIAFYSVGESLSLANLETRLNTLYAAIGAAIP